MSIIDDTRELAARESVGEGYIIAFQNSRPGAPTSPDAYYRTLFVHPFGNGEIRGGSLRDATLYPTYQAAASAAAGWSHTRKPGTRIIHIKKTCPYEVVEDLPANILDAMAEL